MVYCGRPSKACASCRTRRIKCDLRRPGCTQCSKISKDCPGYRDQLDLTFRDESAAVVRKSQNRQKRSRSPESNKPQSQQTIKVPDRQPEKVASSLEDDDVSVDYAMVPMNWAPNVRVDDIATMYFMGEYIRGSHFDYMPSVYLDSPMGSPLFASINANACANLYRETLDPVLLEHAQKHYIEALKQTNAAISNPELAKLDSTISSILLLGLYETFRQGKPGCPHSFTAHNTGALALLKLRGDSQFKTMVGRRIHSQVSLNLRVNCSDRHVNIPKDLLEVDQRARTYAKLYAGEQGFLRQFLTILDEFNALWKLAKEEVATGNVTTSWIEMALGIDQELADILDALPIKNQFDTIRLDHDDEAVLDRVYHVYPNHRFAQAWNAARMLRLAINEHIWEHMSLMAPQLKGNLDNNENTSSLLQVIAARTAETMVRDICASIPQFCKPTQNGVLAATSTYFLIWPMAIAARSNMTPPDVKEYLVGRLKYVGREARIPQALWAAKIVENGEPLGDGFHLSHVV